MFVVFVFGYLLSTVEPRDLKGGRHGFVSLWENKEKQLEIARTGTFEAVYVVLLTMLSTYVGKTSSE